MLSKACFSRQFSKTTNRQPEKLVPSQTKNRKFRSICGRRIECNVNGQLHSTNHLDTTILWIWPARIRQAVGGPRCQMRGECDSDWQRGKDCEDERFGLHEGARVFIRIPLAPFTWSSCYLPLFLNGSDTEIYANKVWKIFLFSSLHRACCRVTQLIHQLMHLYKSYTLKHWNYF